MIPSIGLVLAWGDNPALESVAPGDDTGDAPITDWEWSARDLTPGSDALD